MTETGPTDRHDTGAAASGTPGTLGTSTARNPADAADAHVAGAYSGLAADGLERDQGMPANTWRLRGDSWEFLRYAVKRLALREKGSGVGALRAERLAGANVHDDVAGQNGHGESAAAMREIHRHLRSLKTIEMYWAGFGKRYVTGIAELVDAGEYPLALERIGVVVERLRGEAGEDAEHPVAGDAGGGFTASTHLSHGGARDRVGDAGESSAALHGYTRDVSRASRHGFDRRPRFEVLIVDETTEGGRDRLRDSALALRSDDDNFIYEYVVVPSADDAVAALVTNPRILACIVRPGFSENSSQSLSDELRDVIALARAGEPARHAPAGTALSSVERVLALAETLQGLRPEIDLYLMAGANIEDLAGAVTRKFRRVFLREDRHELHLSLLRRVSHLYDTPFFDAIKDHARRPVGVFHALPVARGASVLSSRWIRDLGEFYGLNLLFAETSATSGGLDSLLAPVRSLKKAQELAARAYGARHTFFVTNGTSTANKIVHQAVCAPGEVVMVDRNCHKSHHHSVVLTGAKPAYLDAYPLNDFAFYGAVPLSQIKRLLLDYRDAGRLHEVRMLTLTNCTFDGIVYDPERVMAECLAIKPDLVFLWDEAWFAFASFHPVMRRRTAMAAAANLDARLRAAGYEREWREQQKRLVEGGREAWLRERLLPAPDARLRVYATQSTHKTLTALRQGSMIHVWDEEWLHGGEEAFSEAYMMHTSTSPNYQILSSLDCGRRQVELEGYELVQRQLDLATSLAQAIGQHPLLRRNFKVLTARELLPRVDAARTGRASTALPLRDGLNVMWRAWAEDEFVVDPSRVTIDISCTGIDGDGFKHEYLMDRYGIQVNKTSRNTVLFMTNIGTSRSAIAYLIEVLVKLAERFEQKRGPQNQLETRALRTVRVSRGGTGEAAAPGGTAGGVSARAVDVAAAGALVAGVEGGGALPPLPDFSCFAEEFAGAGGLPDGDMRKAFFCGQRSENVEHVRPKELRRRVLAGECVVSAGFVTPYPPGFPVLVPGQVVSCEVLEFMRALDTREIHGFDVKRGYRVFR